MTDPPAQQGSCAYALVHPVALARYTLMHEARMLYKVLPVSCDGSRSLQNDAAAVHQAFKNMLLRHTQCQNNCSPGIYIHSVLA